MLALNKEEMIEVTGGKGFTSLIAISIGMIVTFISGIISGFTNPHKCG